MREIIPTIEHAPDDVALLREAREQPESFGLFYRQNAERLYRWLLRETGDAQTATDLTAETFAAALAGLKKFRGEDPGSGVAWLFGIARNLLRGWHRRRRVDTDARRRLGMSERAWVPSETEETDNRIDAEMLSAELADAFDDLPPNQREAIRRHVIDGWSNAEVAHDLGISEANVRMRVSRGLRSLRATFRPTGTEER
jgi:RNA polymerase sigma factor (sigma-70 family)